MRTERLKRGSSDTGDLGTLRTTFTVTVSLSEFPPLVIGCCLVEANPKQLLISLQQWSEPSRISFCLYGLCNDGLSPWRTCVLARKE